MASIRKEMKDFFAFLSVFRWWVCVSSACYGRCVLTHFSREFAWTVIINKFFVLMFFLTACASLFEHENYFLFLSFFFCFFSTILLVPKILFYFSNVQLYIYDSNCTELHSSREIFVATEENFRSQLIRHVNLWLKIFSVVISASRCFFLFLFLCNSCLFSFFFRSFNCLLVVPFEFRTNLFTNSNDAINRCLFGWSFIFG